MSALISWCVGGATIVHQAGLRRPCLVTAFCFLLLRTATGPATPTAGLYSATAALTPLARLGSQIIPTWNQAAGIFLVYSGLVNALSLYLTIAMLDSVQLSLIMIIHLFVSMRKILFHFFLGGGGTCGLVTLGVSGDLEKKYG